MQPTEKYYEHDAYRREAVGHILAAEPDSRTGGGRIALDGTVFYPEGGGQPADRGTLTLADGTVLTVTDVHEQAGVIWHMVTSLPAGAVPGAEAAQAIDWAWRFDKMQQHTGEHILSGILHSMFGAENVGFHIGSDAVRMDTNIPISAEELKENYDAVVLCCGAKKPRDIGVPGRDAEGIYFAVDYLTSVTKSLLDSNFADGKAVTAKGKKVLVIGGGDTGNDCVGTAIRQGCESVMQLEMMPCPPAARAPGNDWPEWPRVLKTDYGQQEAIAVFGHDPREYQTTVKEFYKNEAGQVCGALIARLESKVVDGRRMMVPTGEEFSVECDLVLIAAGFLGCEGYVAEAFGVDMTPRGNVADVKYATSQPKVFVCGDMRRGQSLVVWALREGRDTAAVVDESLMGYTNL